MKRPTRDQVDQCLRAAEAMPGVTVDRVLADEVRALRATIVRIEAAAASMREAADRMERRDLPGYMAVRVCADEVDTALRAEDPPA